MGRHKEWRKVAKKKRRQRIRQRHAEEREALIEEERRRKENSPRYKVWAAEQEALELFQRQEEERLQLERHRKWEEDEKLAQVQWKELQDKLSRAREEKAKQEVLIREEWEAEQKKVKEAEEEEKKKQEEKQKRQDELLKQVDDYIQNGGDLPESMNISRETNPDKPLCPFFSKTGACRFGDRCSRNHPRPGISRVLLIPSFYSHFSIEQSLVDEYDTDLLLEYEDSETYQHFKDFYEDVLPEMESYGQVVQFKVCRNFEPHLRGNVYVEYLSTQQAVRAFQKLQGRWFGGRQLNVEFTCVQSWKAALCGLFFKGRCPKGKGCNFLHVFRNPGNAFASADHDRGWIRRCSRSRSRSRSTSGSPSSRWSSRSHCDRQAWRWSESPEPNFPSYNGSTRHNDDHSSDREKSRRNHDRHHSKPNFRTNSRNSGERISSRHRDKYSLDRRSERGEDESDRKKDRSRSTHSKPHRKVKRRKTPRSRSRS